MSRALPLEGIRVVNFGWVWAGPAIGQTLGFLGAEVLKIESRARLDPMRRIPPFHGGRPDPDRSLAQHACWAGNGSVTLDLKQPEALDLVRRLIARSDVVVENFSPRVMESLGLGYPALRALRDDIVLFSMPAAGSSGPMRDLRTYGTTLTALTGLDSLTGYKGGPPMPVENAFSDPYTGIFAAFAIVAALRHRRRTGEGQHVEFSQQESVMQMVGPAYMDWLLNGAVAGPKGNEHPLAAAAPHGVFPCQGEDRWISIVCATEEEWRGLLAALPDATCLQADAFATLEGRLAAIDALHEALGRWTARFEVAELALHLQRHGVAAAPVSTAGDLASDPHLRARNTFVRVSHPLGFEETIYGAYVKTSRTRPRIEPGRALGHDNERVFREILGLSEAEYTDLVERRIID